MNRAATAALWILAALPAAAQSIEERQGYQPLVAALHVHSQFSNGHHNVLELAAYAHERGIDVLGLTDSFLTHVRYGLPPLRKLFSQRVVRPGVLDHGVPTYLNAVDEARRRFDRMVILAGVEAAPAYRWEGSPRDELRLYDFDRHLLVFGLRDARTLENLPVIGNERWSNVERDWTGAALPVLTVLLAVWTARSLRRNSSRRRWITLAALLAASVALFYDAWPFGRVAAPYGSPSAGPYQRLIDYVHAHGGLTFWSYPEARASDVRVGMARMISRGSLDSLAATQNYTGFEGLYGDRITATLPGGMWDQLLLEYLRTGRSGWPSITAGIDFHYFDKRKGWYELNQGQTVLWSRSRDESGVLEALARGRGYAVFQGHVGHTIRLESFAARSGESVAIAGETVRARDSVEISAAIRWEGPAPEAASPARVELIRDGNVVERVDGPLPIEIRHDMPAGSGRHYFRLRLKTDTTELLSNPVFVESTTSGSR